MKGGRQGKPAALHLVDGTHQRCRHGDAADIAAQIAAHAAEPCPDPPAWLTPDAIAYWRRIAPELHRDGLLYSRVADAFALACAAYGEVVAAQRAVKKDGRYVRGQRGGRVAHPALGQMNRAMTEFRQYLAEFGLTPRGGVMPGAAEHDDPLEALARRRASRVDDGAGNAPVGQ